MEYSNTWGITTPARRTVLVPIGISIGRRNRARVITVEPRALCQNRMRTHANVLPFL